MLQAVVNLPQLAESDARGEEFQRRVRHHAALHAAIMCRILQNRTRIDPPVRQQPRRFSNITETEAWHDVRFRAEERRLLTAASTANSTQQGGASQWTDLRSLWGNCASPSRPSHEEDVALLVTRRNKVVLARKEFLRARQTPVPVIL